MDHVQDVEKILKNVRFCSSSVEKKIGKTSNWFSEKILEKKLI